MPNSPVLTTTIFPARRTLFLSCIAQSCPTWGSPLQESGNANVFVDSRPVNTLAAANQAELGSFLRCCVQKPREPSEWDADATPVRKRDGQFIFRGLHLRRQWNRFNFRNTHPMPR